MRNRRPFTQQKIDQTDPIAQPAKVAAGCAATGAALISVPLCALLVIGPLFILPMLRGTQSARPPTILDNAINLIVGTTPTPTLAGVPIRLAEPTRVEITGSAITSTAGVQILPTVRIETPISTVATTAIATKVATPTPIPTQTPRPTPTKTPGVSARVTAIISGDTIEVSIGNTRRRVRYIGISAPSGTQCYAASATAANRLLVNGQTVTLEQVGNNVDAAGNLLRLVYLSNNKLVNEDLLAKGAARVQTASLDNDIANRLTAAQQRAVDARSGLWATCGQKP